MEDFELIQRLKRQGKIAIVPACVITSGRRWQKLGVWQTTIIQSTSDCGLLFRRFDHQTQPAISSPQKIFSGQNIINVS